MQALKPGQACDQMTIASARRALAESFRSAGLDTADLDARLLVAHALTLDHAALVANAARQLTLSESEAVAHAAARRLAHEPVARIVGQKEFWSLSLCLNHATLVPRPETETLVEAALDVLGPTPQRDAALRLVDIGTGSGALLLALLSEMPNAFGIGTDLSAEALAAARDNAAALGLSERCAFAVCDIAAALRGPFDLIVSNPPYVQHGDIPMLASEVRDYDPALALDGGPDGLDSYRAIARQTRALMTPVTGRLIVEMGAGQETAVAAIFMAAGFSVAGPARRDLAGLPRALTLFAP